jgi:hypothetical protein
MSVGVYIHDLQAMDEAILGMDGPSTDEGFPHASRLAARRAGQSTVAPIATPSRVDAGAQVAKFERLAREAEDKGKPSVARLHWQMAARHGSLTAKAKLADRSARSHN